MTSSPPPNRLVWRVAEWLWRGAALRAAHAEDDAKRPLIVYEQRARIAAEVGQRTLEPGGAWLAGDASHLASALFVESIGWSLRLVAANRALPAEAARKPADAAELAELVAAEREALLAAAGSPDALSRVLDSVLERGFETRSLTREESARTASELGDVAHALLRSFATKRAAVEVITLQRATRLGALFLLLVAGLVGAAVLREKLERSADLSLGKPWRASSEYDVSCTSPAHECGNGKGYFFHTKEERNPWLEIDLGKPQRFSRVRVYNRRDCCAERVVPLVVEVSNDHRKWQEVARRQEQFEGDWTAKFSATSARYVRLRVDKRTMLHLHDVRVF